MHIVPDPSGRFPKGIIKAHRTVEQEADSKEGYDPETGSDCEFHRDVMEEESANGNEIL